MNTFIYLNLYPYRKYFHELEIPDKIVDFNYWKTAWGLKE